MHIYGYILFGMCISVRALILKFAKLFESWRTLPLAMSAKRLIERDMFSQFLNKVSSA